WLWFFVLCARNDIIARPRCLLRVVVTCDDGVRMTFLWQVGARQIHRQVILDLVDLRLRCPHTGETEGLMNRLRGMWREWGEHDVAVRYHLQRSPQHGGQTLALGFILRQLPWLLVSDISIGLTDHVHCRGDRSLELGCFQVFCSGSNVFLSKVKYFVVSHSPCSCV